jgi:hypothetical protein
MQARGRGKELSQDGAEEPPNGSSCRLAVDPMARSLTASVPKLEQGPVNPGQPVHYIQCNQIHNLIGFTHSFSSATVRVSSFPAHKFTRA